MAAINAENLQQELKTKRVCRFCLSQQAEKLGSIYTRDVEVQTTVPLTVQVMAIASMEVFSDDGMPAWVCFDCRLLFDHCYRFKQMCKHAETLLRQYPLTGRWPAPLIKPIVPSELMEKQALSRPAKSLPQQQQQQQQHIAQGSSVRREQGASTSSSAVPKKILNSSPAAAPEPPVPVRMKKDWLDNETTNFLNKVENNEELSMDDVQRLIAAADEEEYIAPAEMAAPPSTPKTLKRPKLLNKSSIRILNKEADVVHEPRLSLPQVTKDEDGNVSIVTEILDPNTPYEVEPDPIKNAEPVETNVFPCPHCERSFPLLQLRDIHMVNHNRERLFQCGDCDRSFFSKYDLQKHIQTHTGDKPYKCTVCSKAFTRDTLRYRHEKTHTDLPKFICIHCEKPFLSKNEMEKHAERHLKNRPFKCKVCSKAFAFKQGLERHEVMHSRDQPYPCQYCEQSFSTPSKLARHLTAHAGNRPYPCKFCSKSYLLSHHLSRHLRSHKQYTTSLYCSVCEKAYATRDELIYHSAVHATETLVCPLCKEAFTNVDDVTSHIKQHAEGEAYACEFCDLIFLSSRQLQDHIDNAHVEDMIAYHEDDKAQAEKRPIKIDKTDVVNDEILEHTIDEFIIEDLSDNVQLENGFVVSNSEVDRNAVVKQENVDGSNTNQPKVLNEIIIAEKQYNTMGDYIEILESSVIMSNEIGDEVEFLEEPAKKRKVVASSSSQQPTILSMFEKSKNEPQPPQRKRAEPQKSQIQQQVKGDKSEEQSPAAITTMLNALPKGVSVRRNTPATYSAAKRTQGDVKTNSSLQQRVPSQTVTRSSAKRSAGAVAEEQTKITAAKAVAAKQSPTNAKKLASPSASSSATAAKANTSKLLTGPDNKVVKMMLGDKKVKVQKITVTKAEAEAMAKQGRISFKDGNMILTQIAPKSSK